MELRYFKVIVSLVLLAAIAACNNTDISVVKEAYSDGTTKGIDSVNKTDHTLTRYGYNERGQLNFYGKFMNDSASGRFFSNVGTIDKVTRIQSFNHGYLDGVSYDIDANGDTLVYEVYEMGSLVYQRQYQNGKALRYVDFKTNQLTDITDSGKVTHAANVEHNAAKYVTTTKGTTQVKK